MAEGKTEEGHRVATRPLASVSVPVEGVGPEGLLRLGNTAGRGLWVREGRWTAHRGAAAIIKLTGPKEGPDRFRRVWERASLLLSRLWMDPDSPVPPPPPRLFGGFSFRDDHSSANGWEAFPGSYFILPELELTGGGSGSFRGPDKLGGQAPREGKGILTLRQLLPPGEEPEAWRERLQDRLHRTLDALLGLPTEDGPGETWVPATRPGTDPASWARAVERALAQIEGGEFSKVVLARAQTVVAQGGIDPVRVVLRLGQENPGSHVFLLEPEPGRVLVGAAPETIATVRGGVFHATAVAGSIARGETEREREALARTLAQSPKDRHEHRMCVEDMVRRLGAHSVTVRADAEPHVLTLSAIQHLETEIEASLKPGENVLSVLGSLHPTPAVCGLPRDRALEFLREEEPFHRGWYAGPVGWFDGGGNGVFVPALRCAVGVGTEWTLFAGAGIVTGSDPALEWEETRIKFRPVLRALTALGRSGTGNHAAAS